MYTPRPSLRSIADPIVEKASMNMANLSTSVRDSFDVSAEPVQQ